MTSLFFKIKQLGANTMNRLLILAFVLIFIFNSCSNNSDNLVITDTIPSAPILLTPADASTGVAIPTDFSWGKSTGAISYTLQVSTNSSFTSFVYNQSGLTSLTQQVSGLNPLSIYYWRVNATNKVGTSDWSIVWSFTATGPSPMVPVLSNPIDGTITYSAPLTLSWLATSGAVSYTLQVSGNSSFTSFVYNQSGLTSSNQQVTGLTASTYYWRVSATSNYGTSGWSTIWSVITAAPIAPDLSSPVNGATNISVSPSLNWSASGGATSYTLQVSVNSSFTSFVYNQSGLTSLSQQVTGLTAPNLYYWRVSSTNGYGTSGWSYTWSFTVS
jgi:predicted phage tail protein